MKIKKIGWTTFSITTNNISVLTDPLLLKESKKIFPKTESDVVIITKYGNSSSKSILKDNELDSKIIPDRRDKVMEIYSPGEYEIGGIMIRRGLSEDFYIVDEKNVRLVYMGAVGKDFDPQKVKNLGDVDILIIPIGDGDSFMDYETLEKVISNIDPAVLIPCGYKEDSNGKVDVKSKEEFLKHFGYSNVREETTYTVSKKKVDEENQQSIEVIFLK